MIDFEKLGYSINTQILTPAECDHLSNTLCGQNLSRIRAGARHLMSNPVVAKLAIDSRLISIAREFLGASAVPFRATLFEKSNRANWLVPWHQDTALPLAEKFNRPDWGPWSVFD